MAFFRKNEQSFDPDETQTWSAREVSGSGRPEADASPGLYENQAGRSALKTDPGHSYYDDDYDDGLDDPLDDEEEDEELTDEELAEQKEGRIHLFFGAGNMVSIIIGAVLILLLMTLILSMVNFVITDMNRNFVLLQTHF